MRLGVGGVCVAIVLAGAFALPSTASHVHIDLQALDTRIALSEVEDAESMIPMRFAWSPPDPSGSGFVLLCWNGRFDRARLTEDVRELTVLCSSSSRGLHQTTGDAASARFFPIEAGRYEAFVRQETPCEIDCFPPPPRHWNASNVVAVDVVDPCRLLPWVPMLQLSAGGSNADLSVTLKSHLAQFATFASTGAAQVIAVSPAGVTFVHRKDVTKVRVRSGRVVALGIGHYGMRSVDMVRFCGRKRPTIACLSRIRYRYFTMRRGLSLKAKVLRRGQSATFRRPRGSVTLVR